MGSEMCIRDSRRMRRALGRAGIGDIVESRHGFGYRLRVIPNKRPT